MWHCLIMYQSVDKQILEIKLKLKYSLKLVMLKNDVSINPTYFLVSWVIP